MIFMNKQKISDRNAVCFNVKAVPCPVKNILSPYNSIRN